jgi:hypothetical protein
MTPERMTALVTGWVRCYTRRLPSPVAERRSEEMAADLHDHVASHRANGVPDPRIARGIASRMIRGLRADLAWHWRQARIAPQASSTKGLSMPQARHRSVLRIAIAVAVILAVPLVGTLAGSEVHWRLGDFILAAILLTVIAIVLELAVRRRGSLVMAGGIAVSGIAAALFGNADDAPGMVLLGILLVGSAGALVLRRVQSSR